MGIWDLMGTGSRTTVGVRKTRKLGERTAPTAVSA